MKGFKWLKHGLSFVLLFLAILMIRSTDWAIWTFNSIEFSEIVYHLKVPISGTSQSILTSFFTDAFLFSLILTLGLYGILFLLCKKYEQKKVISIIKGSQIVVAFTTFALFAVFSLVRVNALDYVVSVTTQSTFIEENYVNPKDVEITFPDKKRNLIYIFLESMESTYLSVDEGGYMEENLIPGLHALAKENINFSSNRGVGGFYPVKNTTWTIAAMVAQTMGIPLSIPIDSNRYYGEKPFLPGATSIGDILDDAGYNQKLLIGSKAEFGARNLLFSQHGNYEILDYHAAIESKRLPSGYFEWWGYEDSKLFEYAKEEILELADEDEPFNMTMLTVNTHFQDGYLEDSCKISSEDKYFNVLRCGDNQVIEFVDWIKAQDFYENTTVVIAGDHLSMNRETFNRIDRDDRTVFNTIINSPIEAEQQKNRTVTTFDLFPTTLGSLGVDIEGDHLGLGVNLYSDERTLAERFSLDTINDEIENYSKFYTDELLAE